MNRSELAFWPKFISPTAEFVMPLGKIVSRRLIEESIAINSVKHSEFIYGKLAPEILMLAKETLDEQG